MNPQTECSHQSTNMYMPTDAYGMDAYGVGGMHKSSSSTSVPKTDMCIMREFLSFIVTRLQNVLTNLINNEHEEMLADCLRLWWTQACRYV